MSRLDFDRLERDLAAEAEECIAKAVRDGWDPGQAADDHRQFLIRLVNRAVIRGIAGYLERRWSL